MQHIMNVFRRAMRKPAVRNTCGIVLIGAGLIAMPLPILPGIPLLVAGAAILGTGHPLIRPFRTWIDKFRTKAGGAR